MNWKKCINDLKWVMIALLFMCAYFNNVYYNNTLLVQILEWVKVFGVSIVLIIVGNFLQDMKLTKGRYKAR